VARAVLERELIVTEPAAGRPRDGDGGLPPRLSVVVKGNSTAINVGPSRESRAEGTYPEMLGRFLRQSGIDATVLNDSTAWARINRVFPAWFETLSKLSPDVVVVNFGGAECQPHIFPTWFIARMQRRRGVEPLGPIRGRISRLLDRRIRRFMSRTIRLLSPRLKMRTWRVSPKVFEAELERLIRVVRGKTAGLVLVMTVSPATRVSERLWWNLDARCSLLSDIVRRVVASADDPQVRLIDLTPIVERLGGPDAVIYDGFHWTPAGHGAIAEQMRDEILKWLADAQW
jgi:lysophospholipase L1-like esterase